MQGSVLTLPHLVQRWGMENEVALYSISCDIKVWPQFVHLNKVSPRYMVYLIISFPTNNCKLLYLFYIPLAITKIAMWG